MGATPLRDRAASARVGLAAMLCFTAVAHFNNMRPDLVAMVPPGIPNPELMVTITGICEIVGAIGLLVPRARRIAGWALIVFLLALLPANVYAAQADLTIGGAAVTPLIPRVALQILFIVVIWWSSVRVQQSQQMPTPAPRLDGGVA